MATVAVGSSGASVLSLPERQLRVMEGILRGEPLPDLLAQLCRIVEEEADCTVRASILLVDSTGTRLVHGAAPSLPAEYNRAIDGLLIEADRGTCLAAAASNEVVVTPDFSACPGWEGIAHLPQQLGLVAAWSMPIRDTQGRVLGTFGTYFMVCRGPTTAERELVETCARTAAIAIERTRDESQRIAADARSRFLAELGDVTQPLTEPGEIMLASARLLAEFLQADRCAYASVEDESVFVITGDYSRNGLESIAGRWPVAAFGEACDLAMRAGSTYVVTDSNEDARLGPADRTAYIATRIVGVVCVPLLKDGRFIAAMAVHQATPRLWMPEELQLIEQVVCRCWESLERARVTRELQDSEARYRSMVEANPECVKLVARDGTLLQMNAAGLRMIDCSHPDMAVGTSVYEVIAPEYREAFRVFNENVCAGLGGRLAFESIGLQGTRRAMETTAVPLGLSSGGYTHLAVTRDVTERRAADLALHDSRARLDYAVRLSGIGFWYCDLPFDELSWDKRVKEHFWLEVDARVTLDTFYAHLHPEDREKTREAIEASIANRTPYDIHYRTIDPGTGAIKWVRALGGTAYDADGVPTRFDGVTVDVTAQKASEDAVKGLAARLQTIIDTIPTGLMMLDENGALTLENDEWKRTWAGKGVLDSVVDYDKYKGFRPDTGARIAGEEWPYALSLKQGVETRDVVLDIERFDGARGTIVVSSSPLRDDSGRVVGAVAANMDITELRAAQKRLEDADRRKDEFLAMLAHELRNPLAPISTAAQILKRFQGDPARIGQAAEVIGRQVGHLTSLVDDLLDVSRVTRGLVTIERAPVDLRAVAAAAVEQVQPLLHGRHQELHTTLAAADFFVEGDFNRLVQVVTNLLTNSVKYTPTNGRIELHITIEGGQAIVCVSDNGVGISPDLLPGVFELFTQAERTPDRTQGGLGIGLALVRSLVGLHGGSVEAHSEGMNRGSTFTVRLPLASAQQLRPVESGQADHAMRPRRVLVVDDNTDAADTLAILLGMLGHEVAVASDGASALEAASRGQWDTYILDIGLPDMTGFQLAERLKGDAERTGAMFIALTGYGQAHDYAMSKAAGFDHHLVKPPDIPELLSLLEQRDRH